MSIRLTRSQISAALVALLVLSAGCSALDSSGAGSSTATEEPTPTDATGEQNGENSTADNETSESVEREAALSGRMLVAVDGQDKHLETGPDSTFWFNESRDHTWHAEEPITLTAALKEAGVEASADSLTYDGTTYSESDANTTITYRVAGTEIEDPSEYKLEDLDPAHEIVVNVDTDAKRDVPGRELEQSHPHPHGQLDVTVDGEPVDFTKEKYVLASDRFHFHGDENASRWHGHSLNLTVAYAVSTFPGMNMTADSLTYNGTTYRSNGTGTAVDVTVNGQPVDPESYVLKDGDSVRVDVGQTE